MSVFGSEESQKKGMTFVMRRCHLSGSPPDYCQTAPQNHGGSRARLICSWRVDPADCEQGFAWAVLRFASTVQISLGWKAGIGEIALCEEFIITTQQGSEHLLIQVVLVQGFCMLDLGFHFSKESFHLARPGLPQLKVSSLK